MNEYVGVIKEIDKLGRIVIPKNYRERLLMGDRVELVLTREGILIRNPEYEIVKTVPQDADPARRGESGD